MPKINLNVALNNIEHLSYINLSQVDGIYINLDEINLPLTDKIKSNKKNVYLIMPCIVKESMIDRVIEALKNVNKYNVDAICANSLGDINLIKKWTNKKVFCNYLLNPFNTSAVNFIKSFGVKQITLSPELNLIQIKNIIKNTEAKIECIVAGNIPLVIFQNCILQEFLKSDFCKKEICKKSNFYIKDEKGYKFPIIFNKYCQTIIYNSRVLFFEDVKDISANIRIETTFLSRKEINSLILFYRNKIRGEKTDISIKKIFPNTTTTGHYFRGVI